MLNARIPAMRNQALISFGLFVLGLFGAWEVGGKLAANDTPTLIYVALGFAACVVAVTILRNWRAGFYLFLIWLMFEDLLRKYMGNGLVFFFGKDVLVGLIYISLLVAIRRGREKTFRPPFLVFLSIFFWLGILQMFNQNSPSFWYGLLGAKMYFYYIPLMFAGYALVRSDDDLRKFLRTNLVLAFVIALLGITQAIVGNSFLNPVHLAPELEDLGNLYKTTPLSGQVFALPASVFVSSGRYSEYLILTVILAIGTAGYLLLHTKRGRILVFGMIGLLAVAAFLSGNRGCVMDIVATMLVLPVGFLWGRPWHRELTLRMLTTIRRSVIIGALGLAAMFLIYPKEAATRLEFYAETLLPGGSDYQLGTRGWDYPVQNFLAAFNQPNWAIGNGIGTASLGGQYVARLTGERPPKLGVEEGYGTLIIELGILAPPLWILWTGAVLYYSWKVVRRLRGTRLFPVALAIFWYAFLLLYVWVYASFVGYENYLCNAFLWLLLGVLFRLPDLLANPQAAVVAVDQRQGRSGFWF